MTPIERKYLDYRRNIIKEFFNNLNDMQQEAVLATEGPLLVLAGAGSGKTTVLIHRIANILKYGNASDTNEINMPISEDIINVLDEYINDPTEQDSALIDYLCANGAVQPYEILAITFTNKAANEMKSRLEAMLGEEIARSIWASTFHSACVRILRRDIDKLGFPKDFTIYDTDDSKKIIKECLKQLEIDEKSVSVNEILSEISKAKDQMISPDQYSEYWSSQGDWKKRRYALVYKEYYKKLKDAFALDFDDIILYTVHLLQSNKEVLDYYQRKFKYILVDEYQDTNNLQYQLVHLLAGLHKNICVVGDDDQSIYRFRGANIENILNFEKEYKNSRVIRLEQNYRSTKNIITASNCVIAKNTERKGKTLWTSNEEGERVQIKTCYNESDEANYVASQIMMKYRSGIEWKENAILYRINALSNAMEYALRRNGVPYKVIGGLKFFDRAEVKDMLAYLSVVANHDDNLRIKRIINNPPRRIGNATLEKAEVIAERNNISLYKVFENADMYQELKTSSSKLKEFAKLIDELTDEEKNTGLHTFYKFVCEKTGYKKMLEDKGDQESRTRLENIEELASSIQGYIEENEEATLSGFLSEIALYTDLDSTNNSDNSVIMMTIHTAKGLEFPHVYVVGTEEGIFPSNRSMANEKDVEEERRLCYVAMTRAKETLSMTCCKQRMLYGHTDACMPSRFLSEIPDEYVEWFGKTDKSNDYDEVQYSARSKADYAKETSRISASVGQILDLKPGEMVKHNFFGNGMVLSVRAMGGDALLEIAFDNIGTKKLMLKAASKVMIKA